MSRGGTYGKQCAGGRVLGLVGGCSLLIGAVIGLFVPTSKKLISAVMALGAGVLVSSVAFELMDEAFEEGGAIVGLITTAGFLLSFVLSKLQG